MPKFSPLKIYLLSHRASHMEMEMILKMRITFHHLKIPVQPSRNSLRLGLPLITFSQLNNQFQDERANKSKVIAYVNLLLDLFQVCRVAGCGALVDRKDIKYVQDGAMITVTCTCLKNHDTKWRSSPVFHLGQPRPTGEINTVLATYILTCGMHVKQVFVKRYAL